MVDPQGIVEIPGSGWHSAAKLIDIEAPLTVEGPQGTEYRFKELYDRNTGQVVPLTIRITNVRANVKMDSPHTLIAKYDTYYYLTVKSPYGNPTGSDWYKADTKVTISVPPTVPMEGTIGFLGGKYKFREWVYTSAGQTFIPESESGYVNAYSNIQIFLMPPRPVVMEALWDEDYTTVYVVVGGSIAVIVALALIALKTAGVFPRKTKPTGPHEGIVRNH